MLSHTPHPYSHPSSRNSYPPTTLLTPFDTPLFTLPFSPIAVVKAVAERDLLRVIHMHRKNKAAFSDRFPGCDQQNLLAEEASFSRLSQEVGHITMGDCGSLFEKVATMRAGGSQGVLHPTSPVSSPPRCFLISTFISIYRYLPQ